jgi:hypothetical protein
MAVFPCIFSQLYYNRGKGLLAQLGEHLGHNQDVVGSSPAQTISKNSGQQMMTLTKKKINPVRGRHLPISRTGFSFSSEFFPWLFTCFGINSRLI